MNNGLSIRRVMDDTTNVDVVKAFIREGQLFGIGHLEPPLSAKQFKPLPRHPDGGGGQIHTGVASAVSGKLQSVGPDPTTNLQHVSISELIELGDDWDMRLYLIPSMLNFLKILSSIPSG